MHHEYTNSTLTSANKHNRTAHHGRHSKLRRSWVLQLLIVMICNIILKGVITEKNPYVITRLSGGSCKCVTTWKKQTHSFWGGRFAKRFQHVRQGGMTHSSRRERCQGAFGNLYNWASMQHSPSSDVKSLRNPRLMTMLSPEDHRTLPRVTSVQHASSDSIIYPSTRRSCKRALRCRYPKQNLSIFSLLNECYIWPH